MELFLDETLCSSDESDNNVLEEDRVRIVPVWRSESATRLIELVDKEYENLRNNEVPKRAGRKPAKRVRSTIQPTPGCSGWPKKLPLDCYREGWLKDIGPQTAAKLKMKAKKLERVATLRL